MCGGSTTKDSTPPSDTGAPTNSHNKDSSSKELSNTPLPIQVRLIRGRDHAGSRQPRRPRFHGWDAEREMARGHHPGSGPGMERARLSPPVDCHDGRIVACTAGSGPDAGLADRMLVRAAETPPEGGASPGAFRPRMPLPAARMAGAHGPLRPDTVDGRQRLFPGQRRRGGVLRTHEDGIRLSRALGGAYPRRGAHPDRRLHPLVQPRARQTVARLDESSTIPSEPRNGCMIISKKTSAAPNVRVLTHFGFSGLT